MNFFKLIAFTSLPLLASGCGSLRSQSKTNSAATGPTDSSSPAVKILNKDIDITQTPKRDYNDYTIVNPGILYDAARRDTLSGVELTALNRLLSAYLVKEDLTFLSCDEPSKSIDATVCKKFKVTQKMFMTEWLCANGECVFDDVRLTSSEIKFMEDNQRAKDFDPPVIKTSMGYFICNAAFVGPPICDYFGLKLED